MICGWAGSKSNLGKAAGAELGNEKLHAAVARSTFSSKNVQNTAFSDHFLKLRYGKIARRCSEKHILKSKCTKHLRGGPLFEGAMSKNCTPRSEKRILKTKCTKHLRGGPLFEGAMSKNCTPL